MAIAVGIIGAGKVGSALAQTLAGAGYQVHLGVRPDADVSALLRACGGRATSGTPAEAFAVAEVTFLCVPAAAAVEVVRGGGNLTRKVIVDCTNPVRWDNGPVLAPPPEGSVAAAIAAAVPEARVVKGFNTFGAETHRNPSVAGVPAEALLAGDDGIALERVGEIAARAGFAPIAVGGLRNAALLEALAVLWIQLATAGGQGRGFVFRIARR